MAERDIQSLVESAYAEAEGASTEAPSTSDGVDGAGVADSAGAGILGEQPGAATGGSEDASTAPGEVAAAAQRARDKAGRFAPKDKAAQVAAPPKQGGTPAPPASTPDAPPPDAGAASLAPPPAPEFKAPQSWTPAAREAFGKAPPEVQREVAKREREMAIQMQEHAPAKRFQQEVSQAFQPYAQFAQSIGQTPLALAQQASQVALQISTAPAHIAAKTFADLIRSRPDVQLELINAHLHGEAEQAQPQQQTLSPEAIIQRAKQEWRQEQQQNEQQKLQAHFEQEVTAFSQDAANEFMLHEEHGQAIQSRIAALLRADSKLPLKDAYAEAAWAHPATRAIMQKRADAERAKATNASTQQAKLAASSVKSAPSTGASSLRTPKTDRERVEAAYDTVFGGV